MITINLGTANSWSKKEKDFAEKVIDAIKSDPEFRCEHNKLGLCWNETRFITDYATVIFDVDSSD